MDERLHGHIHCLGYLLYLRQGEFACEYELAEADILQETGLFGRADVALGAGMELYGWQIEA